MSKKKQIQIESFGETLLRFETPIVDEHQGQAYAISTTVTIADEPLVNILTANIDAFTAELNAVVMKYQNYAGF